MCLYARVGVCVNVKRRKVKMVAVVKCVKNMYSVAYVNESVMLLQNGKGERARACV